MTREPAGQFDFASFFNEKVKERGLTLKKVSDLSGIALHDLKNLSEGDFDHLPPAPYLRGYTMKLAAILEFDPELWWRYFEEIGVLTRAGASDILPRNRFALSRSSRYGWIAVVATIVLLYGGFRFSKILGRPALTVIAPAAEITRAEEPRFTVRGTLENGDHVSVNGEDIPLASDKSWSKELSLQAGITVIEVRATKFLGRETRLRYRLVYEPPASPAGEPAAATSSPF